MRKTFATIKNNIAEAVYDTSLQMLTLIGNYINIKLKDVCSRANINAYNYDYTITTVAGQKDYPLPEDFGKCIGALDTINGRQLTQLESLHSLYRNKPTETDSSGYPTSYVLFESAVMKQPVSEAVISFVSSSASDTTQNIVVRGISNGAEITESVVLTGTSNASTTNTFSRIKGVSKNGNTVGKITGTSGADSVVVMSPKTLVSRYDIVRFWQTPNAELTIDFPYMLKFIPLVEDTDYPLIDVDDIIEIGGLAMAHSYQRREATANKYESVYESMITNYIWDKENQPDKVTLLQPKPYSRDTV